MRKITTHGIFIFAIISAIMSSSSWASTSCITCHTNESIMKSLYRPPQIPAGEGEG